MFGTGPLCGSAGISHHAVGGSAASLSDLLLLLENWGAMVVPKLPTQVCHKAYNQRHLVFCILNSGGTLGFLIVCCFTCSKAVNYYELLGVNSNATSNEIKNAFFEKSKKVGSLFPNNHPKKMCRQRRAA